MKITPVSAIRNMRSLTEVYQRHEHFYRHLKETDQKKTLRRPSKIETVKPASHHRSIYKKSIYVAPDFRVSISQSARNRAAYSDVIDLVPTLAPDHTILFEPLP